MLTPKSQVPSSQSTARKAKGSSTQLMTNNHAAQKICTESPKVEKIIKVSQKLLSPNQKGDSILTNRISSQRSRSGKSGSISIAASHSRAITSVNHLMSVRNSSLKSQNDSILGKTLSTVTSKISQPRNISYPKAQKSEMTSITIDLKDFPEKESFEITPKAVFSQTLSSPQAIIKARDFIKDDKGLTLKENSFRFASVLSPRIYSARKSPLRSGRNSNRVDLNKQNRIVQAKNLGCHKKSLSLQGAVQSSSKKEDLPMYLSSALNQYGSQLSAFEKKEISKYEEIYFISDRYHKIQARQEKDFDDDKGDYLVVKKDHIRYRYEIVEMLGRGSFGQVLKVYDHKQKEYLAIKIIRSQKKFHFQSKIEISILEYIMSNKGSDYNIMGLKDSFSFRNHVCLVFELMSSSLYDFLKKNKFRGFKITVIRKFAIQILYALKFLTHHKLIHCDLKPENILLKHSNKTGIKLIDFGSSCFESQKLYTYIQSRFYRAPEVILGLSYSSQIDMWSFGCLLYELYVGEPIFPGENEQEQLLCMMEVLGIPEKTLIAKSSRKQVFFDQELNPRIIPNSKGRKRMPNTIRIENMIQCQDTSFLDLIKRCLVYNPIERFTPTEALAHEWILGGLPIDLQAQHIKLMESSPEKNSSVKIMDEVLNPIYAKQPLQFEHNRNTKMDTEPSFYLCKSPKSKKNLDTNDLEISIKEVRSEEKPKKPNNIVEKCLLASNFTKRTPLNAKQFSEEDSIVNVTINLNDTNKDLSIQVQQPKKTNHTRGSMAAGTHRRSDSYSLVNNSIFPNAKSYCSTNRTPGPEKQVIRQEMKLKRGFSNKEVKKEPYENSNFKSIVQEMSLISTTNNNILFSNLLTGDNDKSNSRLRDSTTFNASFGNNYPHSHPSGSRSNTTFNADANFQKVDNGAESNQGAAAASDSQIVANDYNILNNNLFESVFPNNKKVNNSVSGAVTNIELYKTINSPSQSKKLETSGKGESIYSNSQPICSINSNNLGVKSPQSTRLAEQPQKLVLSEKKLNNLDQLYRKENSPKATEVEIKARIGIKQNVTYSFSPRNFSLSKLKHSKK